VRIAATRAATIVAGLGLLLALAALLDTRGGPGDDLPSVRVTFTVPDGLLAVSGVILALAWIVFLVAARRARKPEEEPEAEPLRLPWWRQALTQVFLTLPLLLLVAVLWLDGGRIASALLAWGQAWSHVLGAPSSGAAESPVIALPALGWTFGLLALAVALLTLAVALLLLLGDRLVAWRARRETGGTAQPFVEAVDESLDDLADEPDPRVAIIRCYRRFEQAAARAQVRRAPWQTAEEFMRDAQQRLPLPDLAVERVTRLFEVARFSHHPVGSVERDLARACLEEIRTALERRDAPIAIA
jgi:hypothetical protein